jgi:hypothetical protein
MSSFNPKRSSNSRTSSMATIRRHSRSLEINLQRGIETELKGLVLLFTHWVQASGVSVAPSKPHEYWRWLDHTITYLNFKKEMWVNSLGRIFSLSEMACCATAISPLHGSFPAV